MEKMSKRSVCLFYAGIVALVMKQFDLFTSIDYVNFIDDVPSTQESKRKRKNNTVDTGSHHHAANGNPIDMASFHIQPQELPFLTNTSSNVDLQNNEVPQRRSIFPPHLSQWLDDMDTSRPSPCGAFKCVYESKSYNNHYYDRYESSQSNHDSPNAAVTKFGYLVAQPTRYMRNKGRKIIRLQKSWEHAQLLSNNFGIHHFLLGPPERLNCSEV